MHNYTETSTHILKKGRDQTIQTYEIFNINMVEQQSFEHTPVAILAQVVASKALFLASCCFMSDWDDVVASPAPSSSIESDGDWSHAAATPEPSERSASDGEEWDSVLAVPTLEPHAQPELVPETCQQPQVDLQQQQQRPQQLAPHVRRKRGRPPNAPPAVKADASVVAMRVTTDYLSLSSEATAGYIRQMVAFSDHDVLRIRANRILCSPFSFHTQLRAGFLLSVQDGAVLDADMCQVTALCMKAPSMAVGSMKILARELDMHRETVRTRLDLCAQIALHSCNYLWWEFDRFVLEQLPDSASFNTTVLPAAVTWVPAINGRSMSAHKEHLVHRAICRQAAP